MSLSRLHLMPFRSRPACQDHATEAEGSWRRVGHLVNRACPTSRTRGSVGRPGGSEQFADQLRGPSGTFAIDSQEVVANADLLGDRRGDLAGGRRLVAHMSSGAVSLEAVVDVAVLLEVVLEGEVQERSSAGDELHAGGEAALDDGEVASGQVPVEARRRRRVRRRRRCPQ